MQWATITSQAIIVIFWNNYDYLLDNRLA